MSIATLWDAGSPQAPTGFSDWGETLSDAVDSLTDDPQWRLTNDISLASANNFPTITLNASPLYQSVYIEYEGVREESGTGTVFFVGQNAVNEGDWRSVTVEERLGVGKNVIGGTARLNLTTNADTGIAGWVKILRQRRILSQSTSSISDSDVTVSQAAGLHLAGNITAFDIRMSGGTFQAGSTIKVWEFF